MSDAIPAGTEFTCPDCAKVVASAASEIVSGMAIVARMFVAPPGADPWVDGMALSCRDCGVDWGSCRPSGFRFYQLHTPAGWVP